MIRLKTWQQHTLEVLCVALCVAGCSDNVRMDGLWLIGLVLLLASLLLLLCNELRKIEEEEDND